MTTRPLRDWERIKRDRTDLTDYLIHWTKARSNPYVKPFEVLKEIVACGYLKPDFAPRHLITVGGTNNTIKGPHPAVCFSEQPLWAYLISAHTLSRYERYGLTIHKWALYEYGARPVIYGDEQTLGRLLRLGEGGYEEGKEIYTGGLPVDEQCRWARFDPVPQEFQGVESTLLILRTKGNGELEWSQRRRLV